MADLGYAKRSGDRREGRRLRTMDARRSVMPYFMRKRSESLSTLADSVEVSSIERWLLEKRAEGWAGVHAAGHQPLCGRAARTRPQRD